MRKQLFCTSAIQARRVLRMTLYDGQFHHKRFKESLLTKVETITENVTNGEVLWRIWTIKKLALTIRKRQLEFCGYMMNNEGLENLTLIRHIEGKRNGGKQWETYLTNLNKCMEKQIPKESRKGSIISVLFFIIFCHLSGDFIISSSKKDFNAWIG